MTDSQKLHVFRREILWYWRAHGRDFPWRRTRNPYRILISEIMLQQTQTERVLSKYRAFLRAFPNFGALERANLREVLFLWQGLGYNRRAVALKKLARAVVGEYGGKLPRNPALLNKFPGVGPATAGAIAAFAYNLPVVFIETNIRRVFIHFFFPRRRRVDDREILPLVEKTLDRKYPCRWYWALMDYGAMLGSRGAVRNPNRKSAHYRIQASFRGSRRELRGKVLRTLLELGPMTIKRLGGHLGRLPHEARVVLEAMCREGLLRKRGDTFFIR